MVGPDISVAIELSSVGSQIERSNLLHEGRKKKKKKQPNSCVGFSAVLSTGFHFVDSVRWLCTVRALPDSGSVFQLAGIEKFTVRETEMCLFSSSSVAI